MVGLDHFTTIVWPRLLQQLCRQEIWRPRRHLNTLMVLTETLGGGVGGCRRLGWADGLSLGQDLDRLTPKKGSWLLVVVVIGLPLYG